MPVYVKGGRVCFLMAARARLDLGFYSGTRLKDPKRILSGSAMSMRRARFVPGKRKEYVDQFTLRRPFEPFEINPVEGQHVRFKRIEEFLVGRNEVVTTTRRGQVIMISLGLISTIGPLSSGGRRRPRNGGPRR